jgi:hypothetical protein
MTSAKIATPNCTAVSICMTLLPKRRVFPKQRPCREILFPQFPQRGARVRENFPLNCTRTLPREEQLRKCAGIRD